MQFVARDQWQARHVALALGQSRILVKPWRVQSTRRDKFLKAAKKKEKLSEA